jgi:hypothetical protein
MQANIPFVLNENAINWLNILIHSRISEELFLSTDKNTDFVLSVAGLSDVIMIKSHQPLWCLSSKNLPCVYWEDAEKKWESPLGVPLPMVGFEKIESDVIEKTVNGYTIHYDILGAAFWMMTRVEEIDSDDLDCYGRFPAIASHAYKYDYLDRPVIDEWLSILCQVVKCLWPRLPLIRHTFHVRVSHDVDNPSRYAFTTSGKLLRLMIGDIVKRKDVVTALKAPFLCMIPTTNQLNSSDPYNTFDWIMDVSEKNNLKSAFYFICGRTNPLFDGDYEIEHPAMRDLLRKINVRGHEVGLHPSYETYQRPELIEIEAERLKKVCADEGISQLEWGGRMHFLRWKTPITIYGWERASMNYDNTLSYGDLPGFRCGTCFEYRAFDPIKMEMLNLKIRPLIAMECTVMAKRYMNLGTGHDACRKFMELKNAAKSVSGTFTLLWHNSQLMKQEERDLYSKIVQA